MDQVRALNFMNNAAFLSLEKGVFKSWRKASLDMYAPLSLQHSQVSCILFQVQRQKIVFADNLLFSLVVAAGCLGSADKLGVLPASHSGASNSPFPLSAAAVGAGSAAALPCLGGQGESTTHTTLGSSRSHTRHLSNRARAIISVGEICCSSSCI